MKYEKHSSEEKLHCIRHLYHTKNMEKREYIEKFNQLKNWIDNSNLMNWNHEELFKILSSIKEKPGHQMKLHVASDENGFGDITYFYFDGIDGNPDRKIERYLDIAPTPMGIWELFILKRSYTLMPYFWHGGYNSCIFIFSLEDLKKCGDIYKAPMGKGYFNLLFEEYELPPRVEIRLEGDSSFTADVKCCLWNDWRGFYKVHWRICSDGSSVSMEELEPDVLYKYKCPIIY